MCGIVGIISHKTDTHAPSGAQQKPLEAMVASLHHRGPDDQGTFYDSRVALGSCRLAIIDISPKGHQPMSEPGRSNHATSSNDIVITYNGETYNFPELKKDPKLQDETFRSDSDTEVLLKLYKHYGLSFVEKLNGMFAFALYDVSAQKIHLVRDRLGVKPLYYSFDNDRLIFASEIRAILASGSVPRVRNDAVISSYLLTGSVPEPHTIIKGVFMLPPGNTLTLDIANWRLGESTPFWQYPSVLPSETRAIKTGAPTYEQTVARVRELLEDSVRIRLIADVPLGAFLSGGLDSSAIVGLMQRHHTGTLKTFSVVFPENQAHSEQSFAQQTAHHFHTDHTEVGVTGADVARELPAIFRAMDQPTIDGINTYFVSQAARAGGLTVSLSGVGGDELFMGYPSFQRIPSLARIPRLPSWLSAWFFARQPKLRHIANTNDRTIVTLYAIYRAILLPEEIERILKHPSAIIDYAATNAVAAKSSVLNAISQLELTKYMRNQLLRDTDAMSMAHSLEVRTPFLDYRLVEFVTGVRAVHKLQRGRTKPLLVDAIKDLLPPEILNREKHGFAFPLASFLRTNLKDTVEQKVFGLIEAQGILNVDWARIEWSQFLSGKIHWSRVWIWIALTLWNDAHMNIP